MSVTRERGRLAWWRVAVAALVAVVFLSGPADEPAFARSVPGMTVGSWELQRVVTAPVSGADQGVATVIARSGRTVVLTRGDASMPAAVSAEGWVHIGDPDSRAGWVIDAYQGASSTKAKAFALTSPTGVQTVYRHALVAGESYHNSFAAFTPDRRWIVAGEWHTMHRLLVFGTPSPAAATSNLVLASTIRLDRPVRNVQGCVFASARTLLCSTDDPATDLFPAPRQLLVVHLARPVGAASVTGVVDDLGTIPQDPTCTTPGETEGIDVHDSTLIVSVNSACRRVTLLNTFQPSSMPDLRR